MARFRVKIITWAASNIQANPDETVSVSDRISIFKDESVCDYNILLVDLDAVYGHQVKELDISEFSEFLGKPSVILCIADQEKFYALYQPDPKKRQPQVSNYSWLPGKEKFKVINKKGESLGLTRDSGHFSKLFNDYEWEWKCNFSNIFTTPPNYVSIANNITGQSVALRANIGEGRVIIIPTPKVDIEDSTKYPAFLRLLIDLSKEEIDELTDKERKEPDWVEEYVVTEELELRDKIKKLEKEYQTLTEAHKLYYETGKALTKTVNFVISEMGFNSKMREEEGIHDIEICEEDFDLVIEVTSSEDNWININKTRQLLHWCRTFEQEQNNKPKGILIANPYYDLSPADRDKPFTQKAIEHGKAEDFCLMTTEQLYNIFCKFFKDEIDKNEVKKLFLDTTGLLQIQ